MSTENIFRKLRPLLGKKESDARWALYLISNDKQKRQIDNDMRLIGLKNLGISFETNDLLLPPERNISYDGKYRLGKVVYGNKIIDNLGLNESELMAHAAILGTTGAGKTSLCCSLLAQLFQHRVPFWVFDFKDTYRNLLEKGIDVDVFTVGDMVSPFQFNPLIPPNNLSKQQEQAYQREIISLLCDKFLPQGLLTYQGVEYLFMKSLDALRKQKEVPTFDNLYQWITRLKGSYRENEWKYTLMNSLYKITTGPSGLVYRRSNIPLENLLKKQTVFELSSLGSERDKAFFIEAILLWIYRYFKNQPLREQLQLVLVIEESHHVLKNTRSKYQPITDIIFQEIREYGCSLILLEQNPSLLSISALGNCNTVISLNLKHYNDTEAVGKSMQLSNPHVLGRLKTGQAIARIKRTSNPFLIYIPDFQLKKGVVKDSVLSNRHKKQWTGKQSDKTGCFDSNKPIGEFQTKKKIDSHDNPESTLRIKDKKISLLLNIANHPVFQVVEHYDAVGVNRYLGTEIQKEFLRDKLIKAHKVRTSNGLIKLLSITELGERYLRKRGYDVNQPKHVVHSYWVRKVKDRLIRNSKGEIRSDQIIEEYPIKNGAYFVDLVIVDKNVAIEVETGKSDFVHNIRKCLEHGFGGVISVATNKDAFEKIKRDLANEQLYSHEKVEVKLIR